MTTLISEQVENQQENGSELNMVTTVTSFLNQNSKGFSSTSENIKKNENIKNVTDDSVTTYTGD